ncbi:hypothetical protein ES707_09528 [subsurface metagenome]
MPNEDERVDKWAAAILMLRAEVARKGNLVDALKVSLKAREELIDSLFEDLTREKQNNLRWEEFGHAAITEQQRLLKLIEELETDLEHA